MPMYNLLLFRCVILNLLLPLSTPHFSSLLHLLVQNSQQVTHVEQLGRPGTYTGLLRRFLLFQVTRSLLNSYTYFKPACVVNLVAAKFEHTQTSGSSPRSIVCQKLYTTGEKKQKKSLTRNCRNHGYSRIWNLKN